MRPIARVMLILLSVLTGSVFVYSAYTKAFPFYSFEATLGEYVGLSYIAASVFARLFVGIEAAMGLLLMLNIYGRQKWVLKAAAALLMVFNIYLVYLWVRFGAHVNCGCFGDAAWMDPPVSLAKNALLFVALVALVRYQKGITARWSVVAVGSAWLSLLIIPFILSPISVEGLGSLNMSAWYLGRGVSAAPPLELRKGKYIIAFLSPSCSHCRKAAKRIHEISSAHPGMPFFMVIGGLQSNIDDFWKESGAIDVPHIRMDKDTFMKNTGGIFPQIYWVKDGRIVSRSGYRDLKAASVENWVKN